MKKCTGCGIYESCQGPKIWNVNQNAVATNLRYCHLCTICASKCPEDAITIVRMPQMMRKVNTRENF